MPNPDNIEFYDANAESLANRYNSITTEKALSYLTKILIEDDKKGQLLDIGSGAGRDALWFAECGWMIDAIDASAPLLSFAKENNPHKNISYSLDRAPDFPKTQEKRKYYDVIVMSAFLFHFDDAARATIMNKCIAMLRPDGIIHMTLRHGPLYEGRNIFLVEKEEIESFAQKHDLSFKYHGRTADESGLQEISWDNISLWRGDRWAQSAGLSI